MSSLHTPVSRRDHLEGSRYARVVIVEYGDFQCGRCGEAYWELKRLVHAYVPELALVWRHFPLSRLHPHALAAAEAAEAAASQGRFWEMHDLLFENQEDLTPDAIFSYADELGLDLSTFVRETLEHGHRERIERDVLGGTLSGLAGTPGLFVNGQLIERASLSQTVDVLLGGGAAATP
ncbi:MAG: DsbA family protein [Myxococcaceae bacterium]|nr:DsbA family protein [Myxococcaceae bacterium]